MSRVENGHTIPSVETLEKIARALDTPLYLVFHEGDSPVEKLKLSPSADGDTALWGTNRKERRELKLLAKALARMNSRSRNLLMRMAATMAERRNQSSA